MGERERLACDDPDEMWVLVCGRSDRKLRLFVVALCRQLWNVFHDERSRTALEVAERYADELASEDERVEACTDANRPEVYPESANALGSTGRLGRAQRYAAEAAMYAAMMTHHLYTGYETALQALQEARNEDPRPRAVALFREVFEVFGNPLRPMAFDPAWRTSTALALAQGIYDERAFDRMPILADALQDADCDNDDILNHLRDATAPHVRGCWALDLVLGKE